MWLLMERAAMCGCPWGVVERWRSGSVGVVVGVVWSEDGAMLKVRLYGRELGRGRLVCVHGR